MATTSDPIVEQAEHLRVAIARTARRLRQEAHADLTPTLMAALATVARAQPITPSELARTEGVQRPTATKLVVKLVERGLVYRMETPEDGRSRLLFATAAGLELLELARARKDEFLATRLAALPAEDRDTLRRAAELLQGLAS